METCDQHMKAFLQVVVKLTTFDKSTFTKTTISKDVTEIEVVKHMKV